MSSVLLWAAVGVLGGSGAVARLLVDERVSARAGRDFPYGILVVNLTGAVLLGLLSGLALHGDALLLAGTALLGGYTTFSTWMLDVARALERRALAVAAANVVLSLAGGLAAVAAGRALGLALA